MSTHLSVEEVNSLTEAEARERLQALTELAQSRKAEASVSFSAVVGGADVDFMTSEERDLRHLLVLRLPSFAQERAAAQQRLQERIAQRKARSVG